LCLVRRPRYAGSQFHPKVPRGFREILQTGISGGAGKSFVGRRSMKKAFHWVVVLSVILGLGVTFAQAGPSSTATPAVKAKKAKKPKKTTKPVSSKQDGLSPQTAIVIQAKTEGAGEDEEYGWIAQHYPGYSTDHQTLSQDDKRPLDIITITTKDGKKLDLFFDISNFLGKF
jgi:hypothetical protein